VPPLVNMAVPRWAQESIVANPRVEFWQFHFREDETKTYYEVQAILPRRLVPLLKEYLERYRPILLQESRTPNLFLTQQGRPLSRNELTSRVSNLTLEYEHRRVTPHLIRDIFAFWWLKEHPRDYLTLSKMLWHSNIATTIRIYGSRFDESQALCHVEEWSDHRGDEPQGLSQAAITDSVDISRGSHSNQGRDARYLVRKVTARYRPCLSSMMTIDPQRAPFQIVTLDRPYFSGRGSAVRATCFLSANL
jgi:hypothetical protein